MIGYEKSNRMLESAIKKYSEGKISAGGFISSAKKAGYGDVKANELLKKADIAKAKWEKEKAEADAIKAKEKEEFKAKSAAAAKMKKDNDGVPTVDQVFAKPLRGSPVLGGTGPKKSGGDKKEIVTVKDVLANYDPDKSILNAKPKKTKKVVKEGDIRYKFLKALSEEKAEVPTVDNVMANYDPDKATLGRDIEGNKLALTPKEKAAAKRKALAAKKKAEKESLDKKINQLKEDFFF